MQSVPITTKVVNSNPVHGKVYSIKHYVIKFVSDLRPVNVFLLYPPSIKLTATTHPTTGYLDNRCHRELRSYLRHTE